MAMKRSIAAGALILLLSGAAYNGPSRAEDCDAQCQELRKVLRQLRDAGLDVEKIETLDGHRAAKAYLSVGQEAIQMRRYTDAVRAFSQAIGFDPESVESYMGRGYSLAQLGQYDPAISDFAKAIQLDPKRVGAYGALGAVHTQAGRCDLAIADYTRAIELDPKHAGAYYARGLCQARGDRHELAVSDYTAVIELRPKDIEAYHSRGASYAEEGRNSLAISDFTEALELIGEMIEEAGSRSAVSGGKDTHDADVARQTRRFREPLSQVYLGRGMAWSSKGNPDEAIADFTEAIELNPSSGEAYRRRGLVRLSKGDARRGCFDLQAGCDLGSCAEFNAEREQGACAEPARRQVRVSHIMTENLSDARELLYRIRRGESFEDLAREHSECPSRENGGDLGFIERGQMLKPFEDAAFRAIKGSVTGPVFTKQGVHLIKVTDTRQ